MNKKQSMVVWLILILMALFNFGCALINTAIGAGIAYGIYQATKR